MAGQTFNWLRHFRLLCNRWVEFVEARGEARSLGLCLAFHCQPSLCFSGHSENKDGHLLILLADIFSTYPLKPLNGIQRNFTGGNYSAPRFAMEYMLSCQNPFCGCRGDVTCFSQSEANAAMLFSDRTEKHKTWKRTFRSFFHVKFAWFCSDVAEKKSKMSQPIPGKVGHLAFPIGPKNTNFAKDVKILLHVKFRQIPFVSCRRKVENV